MALIVAVAGLPEMTLGPLGKQGPLFLVQAGIILANVYWLFPEYYRKKQPTYIWYSLGIIFLGVAILMFFVPGAGPPDQRPIPLEDMNQRPRPNRIIGELMINFFFVALSFVFSAFMEVYVREVERERAFLALSKENIQTELQFLKSQINPHFLFNALNNLYTLSIVQSGKTPESIGRLSDMLRYVLYDGEKPKVPIRLEIQYIKDFLALFQLKKSGGFNIETDFSAVVDEVEVPPMILIPFVENALKHSFVEHPEGWVNICLKADHEAILFEVKNSILKANQSKDTVGGIGLQNVKRRLKLLYPNRHQLLVKPGVDQFSVSLKLENHV